MVGSDTISDLVDLWHVVRDDYAHLDVCLREMPINREYYAEMRLQRPTSEFARALRFLYLNRVCYGGVYRVNKAGTFNVPFGFSPDRAILADGRLAGASERLQDAQIRCEDYLVAMDRVRTGDFVFVDPPYVLRGKRELGFRRFSAVPFVQSELDAVVEAVISVARRATVVMLCVGRSDAVASNAEVLGPVGWTLLLERKHRSGHIEEVWVSRKADSMSGE